jgi:hypothetical protein
MHSSYQRGSHGKVEGKKKVMGKERRSKEERFVEKVETYSIFNPRQPPLSPHNSFCLAEAARRAARGGD